MPGGEQRGPVGPERCEVEGEAGGLFCKTFTEVDAPTRLGYTSLVDFVPGHEPYEHLTVVDIQPAGDAVVFTMTVEPMHDAEWTQRMLAGRANELENLARVLDGDGGVA